MSWLLNIMEQKDYKNLQDSVHTAMSLAGIGGHRSYHCRTTVITVHPTVVKSSAGNFELSVSYIRIYFYQYTANGSLQHGKCDFKSIW